MEGGSSSTSLASLRPEIRGSDHRDPLESHTTSSLAAGQPEHAASPLWASIPPSQLGFCPKWKTKLEARACLKQPVRDPRSSESKVGAGEPVAQQLGSPAAFAEDLGFVLSTHTAPSKLSVTPCHERGKK